MLLVIHFLSVAFIVLSASVSPFRIFLLRTFRLLITMASSVSLLSDILSYSLSLRFISYVTLCLRSLPSSRSMFLKSLARR